MRLASSLTLLLASVVFGAGIPNEPDLCADYQRLDKAVGLFSLAQGNTASYRFSVLLEKGQASPFGNDLNIFEKHYQELSVEEQVKLVLLILANYDFEGEYSMRFRLMTAKSKAAVASRLRGVDRRRLTDFLAFYHCDYQEFAKRAADYFGVKL